MILLTLLLAAPWVVGLLVEQRVRAEIDALSDTVYHYDRSWRRSRLEVRFTDGSTVVAHGRHAPWTPPALASFEGVLLPAGQPEPVEFNGRLGLGGGLDLAANTAALEWAGSGVSITAETLALKTTFRASRYQVDLTAASLEILTGGRLPLEQAGIELCWRALEDKVHLSALLTARRHGGPASELEFRVEEVARQPLGLLIEAALAWNETRHDKLNRDLVMLTMASAWQDLRQQGLTLKLPALVLDGDFRLAGRWRFDGPYGDSRFEGGGSRAAVEAWLTPFFINGESGVEELLTALQREGWMVDRAGQLAISVP